VNGEAWQATVATAGVVVIVACLIALVLVIIWVSRS
jgi:hypothetical protein